jgi:hypothetical protein
MRQAVQTWNGKTEPVPSRDGGGGSRQIPTQTTLKVYCNEKNSVAEPHHFYAAPAPGKNFDAAPAPLAPAPAPTLFYCKAKFLKRPKV